MSGFFEEYAGSSYQEMKSNIEKVARMVEKAEGQKEDLQRMANRGEGIERDAMEFNQGTRTLNFQTEANETLLRYALIFFGVILAIILVIAIITISIKNSGNDGRTRQLLQKINITDHKIARKLLKAKGFKIPTNHWRRDVI